MSRLDLDAIAARFRRAGAVEAHPAGTAGNGGPQPTTLAEGPNAEHGPRLPPREQAPPTSARRPKRRRWAMPSDPTERQQKAVDPLPPELLPCPFCRQVHQPVPLGGAGMAAAYSRPLLADPSRPEPLGRQGDETPLVLPRFRPWNA